MLQSDGSRPDAGARPTPAPEDLTDRYEAYRRRQATRLVHMLPKEAVRPLYRRARAAPEAAAALQEDDQDPLAVLTRYCETLLPLPPFDAWRADLQGNPDAHLADLDASAEVPTREAPSTLEARIVEYGGTTWSARLRSFRDDGFWRGYIAFEHASTGQVHRTATVFCEEAPGDLKKRFEAFDSRALQAFLRSALP